MSLENVIGQDRVLNFIKSSIENNRLANSYLFIGPEGVGKTLVAKEFAKALNCEKNKLDPCDVCSSCLKIEKQSHPDIHWIEKDDSGFIKIDQIRNLEKDINLKPFEARKKFFIIKEANCMTAEASNALLKTLEEPPADSILILTTNSAERLFSTIMSRCRKIFFASMNLSDLEKILNDNYKLDKQTSHYLSYFTEGRLGRALSLKENNILKEKNRIINNFIDYRGQGDDYFDLDRKNKQDIRYSLDILMNWFRDILLLKCGIDDSGIVNIDRKKDLESEQKRYKTESVLEIMQYILNSYNMLEYNLNPKIFLEFLRLKS